MLRLFDEILKRFAVERFLLYLTVICHLTDGF